MGRRTAVHAALQTPAHPNLWLEPAGRKPMVPVGSWRQSLSAGVDESAGQTQQILQFAEWSHEAIAEDAGKI
jgi:hypothetical protein